MKARLDRWLATLALGSRRDVREWIRDGRVSVGGRVVRDPALPFETEAESLSLDGCAVDGRLTRHVLLNKPAGLLTAARDSRQPTVMDLLGPVYAGIGCMPVGRLDKDTTGVLLLTTDGELNHRLLSPERHVEKRYRATVAGRLTGADAARFAEGIALSDFTAKPAGLTILSAGEETSAAEVCVTEGKYHQVKRMFAAVGHEVLTLHRYAFGPLTLEDGPEAGRWRELTAEELRALRLAAGMEKA